MPARAVPPPTTASAAPASRSIMPLLPLPVSPKPVFGGWTPPPWLPPVGVFVAGAAVSDGAGVFVFTGVVVPAGVRVGVLVRVDVRVGVCVAVPGVAVGGTGVLVGGTGVSVGVGVSVSSPANAVGAPPLVWLRPMSIKPAVRPARPVISSFLDIFVTPP
jgi:hypothetical protein